MREQMVTQFTARAPKIESAVPLKPTDRMDASTAAILFALEDDEPMAFLRCWSHGDFSSIRREWPDAPEEVFIGADPLHPQTVL